MKPTFLFFLLLVVLVFNIGYGLLYAATIDQFAGNWGGEGIFRGDVVSHETITVNLSVDGNLIAGNLSHSGSVPVPIQGPVTNGVFIFPLPTDDPNNPECTNYDVTGKASLDAIGTTMTLIAEGIFCGDDGGSPGIFTGTLQKNIIITPMMLLLNRD